MAARVVVERGGDGRLVVRKSGDDAVALAAEAGWLRRAGGAGAVPLVAAGPGWVTTLHGGAHTWRTAAPGPAAAAVLVASLLRSLAELHRRGLVHGAVGPDHVLVGAGGRAVLCSPRPGADDPAADRLAVAQLVAGARRRWHDEGTSVAPPWERVEDLLGRPEAGWPLDQVAALLEHPAGARSPGRPGRRRWPLRWRAGALRAAAAAAVVALAVVAAGGADGRSGGGATADGRAGAAPAGAATARAAGGRYRAGEPGDALAVTARPCPGTPPAAVLRPGDGEVWAFAALPPAGVPAVGAAVQRTPGADRLELRADGACERIVAVGPAGEAAVVAAGGVRTG